MGWTGAPFRKFASVRRTTDVNLSERALALILSLAGALSACAAAQQKAQTLVTVTAVTNVSAEDLLARPPGADWTSYNGDYTGQRYTSLREINVSNVSRLQAAWTFHPGNSQRL